MVEFYERLRGTASRLLSRFAQGAVTLTRTTPGEPDPETPWLPGEETTVTFTLDATVRGVSQQYVDGTTILASDLEVVASVTARDGDGAEVEIAPDMTKDTLTIDGQAVSIIRDLSVPAAGTQVALRFIVRA